MKSIEIKTKIKMKRQILIKIALAGFLIILFCSFPAAAPANSSPENGSLEIAQRLLAAGDFVNAISAAREFIFFNPGSEHLAEAETLIRKASNMESGKLSNGENRPAPKTNNLAYLMVKVYQDHLRAFIRSSCPSFPSCSEYALEAIQIHGAIYGTAMGVDRLIRETTTKGTKPFVWKKGRRLHYDPLAENDYWLKKAGQ